MSKPMKPKILNQELVTHSRLFYIEQLHLEFSNGETRFYERMKGSGRGAVMVVPVFADGHLGVIKEYAAGTHSYELGFPKGLIDKGETAREAANRELQEEIGFGADQLTHLMSLTMAPSYFASTMEIFLAEELYPSQLEGDEPEPIELLPWPLSQVDELLLRRDFSEARAISALFLALKQLKLK